MNYKQMIINNQNNEEYSQLSLLSGKFAHRPIKFENVKSKDIEIIAVNKSNHRKNIDKIHLKIKGYDAVYFIAKLKNNIYR